MNEIFNNLIETCEWRNNTIGIPVCTAEIAPCEKIIEDGKCPILIKYFKVGEKIIKDLEKDQNILPMGRFKTTHHCCNPEEETK